MDPRDQDDGAPAEDLPRPTAEAFTAPFPWPCPACLDFTRVRADLHADLHVLYRMATHLQMPLNIEPCETHGTHVALGPRHLVLTRCTRCARHVVHWIDVRPPPRRGRFFAIPCVEEYDLEDQKTVRWPVAPSA